MTEITLQNITKVYGTGPSAVAAVDDVSLSINAGELYFLLGPSGCGKTTLLRMIAGLIEPTRGRLFFGGKDVTDLSVERRRAAMVFQNYALWPHMTVARNVEFGPRMQGAPAQRRRRIVDENLARVQMTGYEKRKPSQLSGGQQQRVALARALAASGQCVLLDEPLSNLDARLRLHMRTELRRLVKETGITAVYVTHDQAEALSMADRIAVMNAGRVAQIGTPQELYERPASRFVADFLGEANFVDGRAVRQSAPAEIETAVGKLVSSESCSSQLVTCCVRPERVEIASAQAQEAGPNCIRATIESVTYLGGMRQYNARLADGSLWKVSVSGERRDFSVNDTVVLRLSPLDVVLLAQ